MRAFDAQLVRQTMKARAISQARLASALGFPSQSAVSALLAGKRRVTVDEAAAIYALLGLHDRVPPASAPPAGNAEAVSARFRESTAAAGFASTPPGTDYGIAPDYGIVPVIGIAGAGRWREAVELPLGHMPVPVRLSGPGVFGIEVNGDSMDLIIEDGGLILVDPRQKELAPGGVFLIANSKGEATVKRYRRDPARFEPCSTNSAHQPFMVSDDDFSVLGKVIWKSAPVV
jgi:SOS-response transcriptional repressor LexA